MALDLERRWERRHSHSSLPGGPVGRHLAEAKCPPLGRHDSSGVVLPDHLLQGDFGSSKVPQHGPVMLEDLLLLLLGGAVRPVPLRLRDGVLVYDGSVNSGSFRK
jgi:hypothetical protein